MTLRIDGVPASTSHDSFHGDQTMGQVMHLSCDLSLAAGAEAAVDKGRVFLVGSFRNEPAGG